MYEYSIKFTKKEIVTILSCCNQAIVNSEGLLREYGEYPLNPNNITLKYSIDYIWNLKTKIKSQIIDQFAKSPDGSVTITMCTYEFTKLACCCNSTIDSDRKLLEYLGDIDMIESTKETIKSILNLKYKISCELDMQFKKACEYSQKFVFDTIPEISDKDN